MASETTRRILLVVATLLILVAIVLGAVGIGTTAWRIDGPVEYGLFKRCSTSPLCVDVDLQSDTTQATLARCAAGFPIAGIVFAFLALICSIVAIFQEGNFLVATVVLDVIAVILMAVGMGTFYEMIRRDVGTILVEKLGFSHWLVWVAVAICLIVIIFYVAIICCVPKDDQRDEVVKKMHETQAKNHYVGGLINQHNDYKRSKRADEMQNSYQPAIEYLPAQYPQYPQYPAIEAPYYGYPQQQQQLALPAP